MWLTVPPRPKLHRFTYVNLCEMGCLVTFSSETP